MGVRDCAFLSESARSQSQTWSVIPEPPSPTLRDVFEHGKTAYTGWAT